MLLPLLVGGWCLFGLTAAMPLALWWWQRRPQPGPATTTVLVDVSRVREVTLGRWRTRVLTYGAPPLEVFHDEVDPASLALLRRSLLEALSAGGRTQHVEPV